MIYNLSTIKEAVIEAGVLKKCKDNKKLSYYNEPLAFDIETSSFKVHSNGQELKVGIMYIWTLAIKEVIIQGRTWEEFVKVLEFLAEWYNTHDNRLIIYVHNLGYEFQFMHKWLEFEEVFSLKERQPVKALTKMGIEFRCSYKLSGYSLENLAKNLVNHDIKKLKGDLDYEKLRHKSTPLSEEEAQYTINDVLIIIAYIEEYIGRVKYIYNIPATKTGEVRRHTRKNCFMAGIRQKAAMFITNIVI